MDSTFVHGVVAKLPLAEAILSLYRWVLDDAYLQELWQEFRGACYEKVISFPTLVSLTFDALVEFGSGRQAIEKSKEQQLLEASPQAVYQKLGRLPLALSEAFLGKTTDRLRELWPLAKSSTSVPSLSEFEVVILDGKVVKNVPKRLRPLQRSGQGVLGGKALVALHQASQLVLGMATDPDGETNEAKLLPAVTEQIRTRLPAPILWLCDRQFYALSHAEEFTARPHDHFLVRYHGNVRFALDPARPERHGQDRHGRAIREQWGWLGRPGHHQRCYVRRLIVQRSKEDLILITSLLEDDRYAADDLLELYFARWGIERVFQKITEVFSLQRLIGTTPRGTIFQLAYCLLLYNLILVVGAYVAQGSQQDVTDVSLEMLFVDVQGQLRALGMLVGAKTASALIKGFPNTAAMQTKLRQLLGQLWRSIWRKSPPKKRRRKEVPNDRPSEHRSAYRLIEEYRQLKTKDPTSSK